MSDNSQQTSEMSFWDHVDALRMVIFRMLAVLIVLTVAYFIAMPWLFDHVILWPCLPDFPTYRLLTALSSAPAVTASVHLINIQLASQFFIHMSTSLWLALVTATPLLLWLLWTFVSPALYPVERRPVVRTFVAGCVLFFAGVATGYFVVFPLTLRFLADYQISASVPNTISLDSYMDNFLMLIFLLGILFELPILAWMLGKIGLLHRGVFAAYRRHAVVALLILAAIITPTGDPLTLIVVFLPLFLLWELGGIFVPAKAMNKTE